MTRDDPANRAWMARPADSWLDETVTVRRVLGLTAFWLACIGLPVVLALAFLR